METTTCTNCGTTRGDLFCPHCGQNSRNYQRALPPVLWELLREAFDLDSRIARTLPALMFKPGELALEFSRNRRASYVSPIRLYLLASLTFFFLLSMGLNIDPAFDQAVEEAQAAEQAQPAEAQPQSGTDALMAVLSEAQQEKVRGILEGSDNPIQKEIVRGLADDLANESDDPGPLGVLLISQIIDALDDPRGAVDALIDNLPVTMFVALPVFALLLKVLYVGKRRYYVEHLVFATHLHTFAFIIYSLLWLLPDDYEGSRAAGLWESLGLLLPATLFVYHFAALKRYYQDGYVLTFFKYSAQMIGYLLVLVPTAVLALVIVTLMMV